MEQATTTKAKSHPGVNPLIASDRVQGTTVRRPDGRSSWSGSIHPSLPATGDRIWGRLPAR